MAIFKCGLGFDFGTQWLEQDSNPGLPVCGFGMLTTQPCCLLLVTEKDSAVLIELLFLTYFVPFTERTRTEPAGYD